MKSTIFSWSVPRKVTLSSVSREVNLYNTYILSGFWDSRACGYTVRRLSVNIIYVKATLSNALMLMYVKLLFCKFKFSPMLELPPNISPCIVPRMLFDKSLYKETKLELYEIKREL